MTAKPRHPATYVRLGILSIVAAIVLLAVAMYIVVGIRAVSARKQLRNDAIAVTQAVIDGQWWEPNADLIGADLTTNQTWESQGRTGFSHRFILSTPKSGYLFESNQKMRFLLEIGTNDQWAVWLVSDDWAPDGKEDIEVLRVAVGTGAECIGYDQLYPSN